MKYDLTRPCPQCPFLRPGVPGTNPVRLYPERVLEVAANGIPCHKTVDHDDESGDDSKQKHCAGSLIFFEKQDQSTQMMRICERLGTYDRSKLDAASFETVFDDVDEMLETAIPSRTLRKRGRK